MTTALHTAYRFDHHCNCCRRGDVPLRRDPECTVHQSGRMYATVACRDCAPALWSDRDSDADELEAVTT